MSHLGMGPQWCVLVCWLCVLAPQSAWAIDIEQTEWGFDGRIRTGGFNPLFVLLRNSSADPFQGELTLTKQQGLQLVDAPVVSQVYLAPFSARWVTMYAYVVNPWDQWQLEIPGQRGMALSTTRSTATGARVILEGSDQLSSTSGVGRRFPELLFPPSITGLDQLQAVLLDHVPRWTAPQRQALVDWLHLGGQVYVLNTPEGTLPEFTEELSILNGSADEEPIGSGQIHRPGVSMVEVNSSRLADWYKLLPGGVESEENSTSNSSHWNDTPLVEVSSYMLRLKRMIQPNHSWLSLHILSILYLICIFPGAYLVGRKSRYWVSGYVMLLSSVAVASGVFSIVGSRGYGESTTVNTVGVAQRLPDGAADVRQWSNVFVTRGGNYRLTHAGTGLQYSTCKNTDSVIGRIENSGGAAGEPGFLVEIPPFSSSEFSHRMRVPELPWSAELSELELSADSIAKLRLTLKGSAAESVATSQPKSLAIYRNMVFNLRWTKEGLQLGTALGNISSVLNTNTAQNNSFPFRFNSQRQPAKELYSELFSSVMLSSLGIQTTQQLNELRLPENELRVFIYAPLDSVLQANPTDFPQQVGQVLHVFRFPARKTP